MDKRFFRQLSGRAHLAALAALIAYVFVARWATGLIGLEGYGQEAAIIMLGLSLLAPALLRWDLPPGPEAERLLAERAPRRPHRG